MTYEEAKNLKRFDNLCNCGGHANKMNGRDIRQPHMSWCPQAKQYEEWYEAINSKEKLKK